MTTMEQIEWAWQEASKTRAAEDIDTLGRLARGLFCVLTATNAELTRLLEAENLVPTYSSVLDEIHDFQRFERRTRGYPGRPAPVPQLKIVCRCGWSADWIDLDPDGDVGTSTARELLQNHVADAIWQAKRNA